MLPLRAPYCYCTATAAHIDYCCYPWHLSCTTVATTAAAAAAFTVIRSGLGQVHVHLLGTRLLRPQKEKRVDTRYPFPGYCGLILYTSPTSHPRSVTPVSVDPRGTDPPRSVLHTTAPQERTCLEPRPTLASSAGSMNRLLLSIMIPYHSVPK